MEYPMCTQSVKRKEFLSQLVYKKSSFLNRKFRLIRLFYFRKYRNFIGSRSYSNRTKLGMEYPICTQSVKEKKFGIACLGKKFVLQSEISAYSLIIRLFYFQKYRNFIGSRSCPNQTKHGMEYPMCTQSVKRKNFCHSLYTKKVRFSIGNFDLFGYSFFENIEILSGQGVVQIEPNSVWSIPSVPRA